MESAVQKRHASSVGPRAGDMAGADTKGILRPGPPAHQRIGATGLVPIGHEQQVLLRCADATDLGGDVRSSLASPLQPPHEALIAQSRGETG